MDIYCEMPCLNKGRSRFDLWIPGGESGASGSQSGLRRKDSANREGKKEKEHGKFQNQAKGMVT
jgi:hypothetical protein